MAIAETSPPEGVVIRGFDAIGALFGRERRTIARWVRREGFPVARLPNGEHITTPRMIEAWVADRAARVTSGD